MIARVLEIEVSSAGITTKVRCASSTGRCGSSLGSCLGGKAKEAARLTTTRASSVSGTNAITSSVTTCQSAAPFPKAYSVSSMPRRAVATTIPPQYANALTLSGPR